MKYIILLFFVAVQFSMSGCDFIEKKFDDSKEVLSQMKVKQEGKKSQEEIARDTIIANAKKYFPDSEATRNAWIERQLQAREDISTYMPNIPIKDFSVIRERAEAKYPSDYVERRKYLFEQSEAYMRLSSSNSHFSEDEWKVVSESIDKFAVDDYTKKLVKIEEWREACYSINSKRHVFDGKEFETIKNEVYKKYSHTPEALIILIT